MNAIVARSLTDGAPVELHSLPARDLRIDSRTVQAGDMFFAVAGSASNGAMYIEQAIQRGAASVVVESGMLDAALRKSLQQQAIRCVEVEHLRGKLGQIGSCFYGDPSGKLAVIGITGTNGKTSCSHWIAQAWSMLSSPAAVMGTLGCGLIGGDLQSTGLTTADVLGNHRILAELLGLGARAVAMEVSSHSLDQGRVDAVHFDTAVFTNLTRDHLDYHGDMAQYARAKQKLFECRDLKNAVINVDDSFGKPLKNIAGQHRGVNVVTYAIADRAADVGVERCEVMGRGITAHIRTPWGSGALQSRFPGGYNLLNVLAVIGTLCSHGMSLQSVLGAVERLQAVPGRTEIVSDHHDDIRVVVDYAHTPDALQKVLFALRENAAGRLWCVFGCGGDRDHGKRAEMGAIAALVSDHVVVTSDNPRSEDPQVIIDDIVAGLGTACAAVVESDRACAIAYAIAQALPGDTVLLAGKGHENYQEIAGVRLSFSDAGIARQALAARRERSRGASL